MGLLTPWGDDESSSSSLYGQFEKAFFADVASGTAAIAERSAAAANSLAAYMQLVDLDESRLSIESGDERKPILSSIWRTRDQLNGLVKEYRDGVLPIYGVQYPYQLRQDANGDLIRATCDAINAGVTRCDGILAKDNYYSDTSNAPGFFDTDVERIIDNTRETVEDVFAPDPATVTDWKLIAGAAALVAVAYIVYKFS